MEHTKFKRSKRQRPQNISFEVPVNNRSYTVSATPFAINNGDIFYRVSYNNGPVHVFGWDDGLDRYAETDDAVDIIPPIIELAIAARLNEYAPSIQHAA